MYKARTIEFKELIEVGQWTIKAYTISKNGKFKDQRFYERVKKQLPNWLKMDNSFNSDHEYLGFLILHSANEGLFSIVNWWVGNNMLNTHVFLTEQHSPHAFNKISGDGLGPCVWEFEVINHERLSWIRNILKQESNPDYKSYLSDVYNGVI